MTISRFIALLSLLMLLAPLAFAGGADSHDSVSTAIFMFVSMPLVLVSMAMAVIDCSKRNETYLAVACVIFWPVTYYVLLRRPVVTKAA